jgi:hypothetical protein
MLSEIQNSTDRKKTRLINDGLVLKAKLEKYKKEEIGLSSKLLASLQQSIV